MENTQLSLFGKMSPERSTVIKGSILEPCLKKSQRPIFQCLQVDDGQTPEWFEGRRFVPHGDCLTLNIGVSPNEESVSTLSEVLEAIVPKKYYLSATACEGILRRAECRGRELPPLLKQALLSQVGSTDKNGPQGNGINENVSFTLNTIDRHAVVYALDRASFNQGANALYEFEVSDSGINSTLVAKGPSAICYEFIQWIVRRLIPLECERLQGYPDHWTEISKIDDMSDEDYNFFLGVFQLYKSIDKGVPIEKLKPPTKKSLVKWYNKLDCDGNRYKALGNSLAIPCALRIIGGISDYMRKAVQ